MPLSAHVLLSLAKRYEVAQFFEVDKFQGLYYVNSVALFLKVPYFCFLGCLKEVAKPFF